jgi:hypothetical protein
MLMLMLVGLTPPFSANFLGTVNSGARNNYNKHAVAGQ